MVKSWKLEYKTSNSGTNLYSREGKILLNIKNGLKWTDQSSICQTFTITDY